MASLVEHLLKLTDHRDRDLLELSLSKALIELVPIQRVLVSKVVSEEGSRRWMDITVLDARGGGKVVDPLRMDFHSLPMLDDNRDRLLCVQQRSLVEVAWAGEDGPRISYLPLLSDPVNEEQFVLEIHSAGPLQAQDLQTIGVLSRVFGNMYRLLAYSDRDALTGLLNRKSLDDAFYSAVLDELGELDSAQAANRQLALTSGLERRHRVPPNYWLGTVAVDNYDVVNIQHGHLIAEEVLLLVARIMNNTFRTYDRLYRLGGEQFAVLMHCPDEALVLAAFERFRSHIETFRFPQVGPLTVSGGFTRVTPDDSPSTALERAERVVDYVHHHGQNKVLSYSALADQGLFSALPATGAVDIF